MFTHPITTPIDFKEGDVVLPIYFFSWRVTESTLLLNKYKQPSIQQNLPCAWIEQTTIATAEGRSRRDKCSREDTVRVDTGKNTKAAFCGDQVESVQRFEFEFVHLRCVQRQTLILEDLELK